MTLAESFEGDTDDEEAGVAHAEAPGDQARSIIARLHACEPASAGSAADWAMGRYEALGGARGPATATAPLPRYWVHWMNRGSAVYYCLGVTRTDGVRERFPGGFVTEAELGWALPRIGPPTTDGCPGVNGPCCWGLDGEDSTVPSGSPGAGT